MCNLYFNHHQPSRHRWAVPRHQPLRRQPRTDAGCVSRLSGTRDPQYQCDGREMTMMRWGMPLPPKMGGPPVTNIHNTSSPHWRGWLKPENRCLVPANSFAECAPQPNPFAFAGIWATFNGDRGTKSKPIPGPHEVYGFSDHCSERGGRADPSQGHAGNPNH